MTFVADQDPTTIEWARTPPPPLLEALETLWGLYQSYACGIPAGQDPAAAAWWNHPDAAAWWKGVTVSYQTAYNVMLRALIEEYAP
jgi:hypothetical protein